MQKEWDNLEQSVKDAFEEIQVSKDYNEQLMMKLHEDDDKLPKKGIHFLFNNSSIAGISFILSGLLMVLVYTSNIQYKLINLTSQTSVLSSQYKIELINNILGVK